MDGGAWAAEAEQSSDDRFGLGGEGEVHPSCRGERFEGDARRIRGRIGSEIIYTGSYVRARPVRPSMNVDPVIVRAMQSRLGPIYDELARVLLDVGLAPLFLFHDDRPRVAAVRQRAVEAIREWEAAEPAVVEGLVNRLPAHFRVPDSAEALLESVPSVDYFDLPEALFEPPAGVSPVLTAVPALGDRMDDDGLLNVAGLEAGPHGILVADLSLHYHQFLRRNFGSNVHYDLIGAILRIAGEGTRVRGWLSTTAASATSTSIRRSSSGTTGTDPH